MKTLTGIFILLVIVAFLRGAVAAFDENEMS